MPKKSKGKKSKSRKGKGSQPKMDATERGFPPLVSLPLIVPDRVRVQLRYSEDVLFNQIYASQPAVQTWAQNSIYDPDVTGIGGTVTGASQWAAFYGRYIVLRSRCKLTLINGTTTSVRGAFLPTLTVATTGNSVPNLCEQAHSTELFLGSNTGGNDMKKVTKEFPVATVFGVDPQQVIDEFNYSGAAVSANPTTVTYWTLSLQSLAGVTLGVNAEAVITYDVVFYKRILF